MPRIRSLKPEHKSHRKVGRLSDREYRLWVGLITEADDDGRLVEDLAQLRSLVFGFQKRTTLPHVHAALAGIETSGLIQRYSVNGTAYIAFPSWPDHQRINRPTASKLPAPPLREASMSAHGGLSEDSRSTHWGSEGSEGSRSEGSDHLGGVVCALSESSRSAGALPEGADWPAPIRDVHQRLHDIASPPSLHDPEFWTRIDQWLGPEDSGVAYLPELDKYLAWVAGLPKNQQRRDHRRGFRNWLSKAERWVTEETRRRAQGQAPTPRQR